MRVSLLLILACSILAASPDTTHAPSASSDSCDGCKYQDKFDHIIVMIMENWSYDSLFGTVDRGRGFQAASQTYFPYFNTFADPATLTQVDANDKPYDTLPQVQPGVPTDLPNKPFDLAPYINITSATVDLTHSFYIQQLQINGGKMNKFAAHSSAKGLTMSYYDISETYLGQLARTYTMFDNWYHVSMILFNYNKYSRCLVVAGGTING
jgi:phospholipase C